MKVVILAGGYGTRLGEKTAIIPKPMVHIGQRPILWHIMKIYSFYGINEFVISLGYLGDVIKDYFVHYLYKNNDFTIYLGKCDIVFHNNHEETNWKVTLVDTGLNTLKGARIKRVEDYLDDEINLLTYGDGVADIDIRETISFHRQHAKPVTITGVRPPARFGELITEGNKLVSFEEKPQVSQGLINGGFMVFNREMLDYLTTDEQCDFEVGPLERMTKEGKVMVYKHRGQWACMDHERDVAYLNRLWNEEKAFWKIWE